MVYGCNDTTTSNILQSYTFTWGKVGKVSCPRTQQWGLKHRPSEHRLTCSTTWATVCAFLCSFPVYWPTTYSAFHIHPFIHTFIHWLEFEDTTLSGDCFFLLLFSAKMVKELIEEEICILIAINKKNISCSLGILLKTLTLEIIYSWCIFNLKKITYLNHIWSGPWCVTAVYTVERVLTVIMI